MADPAVLATALAAAAITPELRTVLVFDVEPHDLLDLARVWAGELEAATGAAVPIRHLGASDDEDRVWGWPVPVMGEHGWRVAYRSGIVGADAETDAGIVPLVVIPDLARLGVAGARAAVALAGTPVASLERHGHSRTWVPRTAWLAACRSEEVGMVSPHLLDRFALRLRAEPSLRTGADLLARLEEEAAIVAPVGRRQGPLGRGGVVFGRVAEAVVGLVGEPGHARRDIALARLAVALTRLDGEDTVTEATVQRAAVLVGLARPPSRDSEPVPKAQTEPAPRFEDGLPGGEPLLSEGLRDQAPSGGLPVPRPLEAGLVGGDEETSTAVRVTVEAEPYPEDNAQPHREAAPLQLPVAGRSTRRVARGPVVGTMRRIDVHDLDLVATVVEAAIHQAFRRRQQSDAGPGLVVIPADLRSHRRAPVTNHLLVLVLDCTCRGEWDWAASLLPWLAQAYQKRAGIVVVQVGAVESDGAEVLRARRMELRSLLDDRIDRALGAAPGTATPLAHGLELALQSLRHALQHGASAVIRAWLVVVTDGRGNVPLAASRAGRLPGVVATEGVDDALGVARELASLSRVERVVMSSEPSAYAELPFRLAEAMGATVVAGPSAAEQSS